MDPIKNLEALGLELPDVSAPGGAYVSVNVRHNIAYIAIQFPILNGKYMFQGRLGEEVSTTDSTKAMELCALNVLAQVHHKIGFEKLVGLNHLDICYQSGRGLDDGPIIADGASELFVKVLGDKGIHSRTIFGVEKLPRNFSVGLTCTFTVE